MMWLTLGLAILVYLGILYVPGYLVGRAFAIERFAAVVIAPLVSLIVFVGLGVVFRNRGFSCDGWVLAAAGTAVCAAVFAIGLGVRFGMKRARSAAPSAHGHNAGATVGLLPWQGADNPWKTAVFYILVALVITAIVFVLPIDGPESFSRNDDTTVHLSATRAFLDTGFYSTLHFSPYEAKGAMYPAAWHVMVAMTASFFAKNVALATNAATIAFIAVVFPLSFCLFNNVFLERRHSVVLGGALMVVSLCGFPWGFIVFGQLFPNMISWILIPAAMVVVAGAVNTPGVSARVRLALIVLAGVLSIAVCQPNGAFVFGIWAVLYGMSRFFYQPDEKAAQVSVGRIAGAVALFAAGCVLWMVLFNAPMLQTTVTYTWKAVLSVPRALIAALGFMFSNRMGVQPLISVFVFIGVIRTLRDRRYLWLTVAYAFAFFVYVIDASTDGVIKQVLSGFWYTDYRRTGALAAFFAIPLATLGFAWVVEALTKRFAAASPGRARAIAGACVAVFALVQFFPGSVMVDGSRVSMGLPAISDQVTERYSWMAGLTAEEDAFVKQAMEQVPAGEVVINVPSDGSCWSYGVEGLNAYFRRSSNSGMGSSDESKLIRTQLDKVSTSKKVRKALQNANAHYVLMLDIPESDHRTVTSLRYNESDWKGIESITEQTPGFTLVLSEDDMRLYRINAAA